MLKYGPVGGTADLLQTGRQNMGTQESPHRQRNSDPKRLMISPLPARPIKGGAGLPQMGNILATGLETQNAAPATGTAFQ